MSGPRTRFWRDLSIQNKVLAIMLPLITVPMLVLAAVGFVTASREAAKIASRYLTQRETDLRTIAENPAIPVQDPERLQKLGDLKWRQPLRRQQLLDLWDVRRPREA